MVTPYRDLEPLTAEKWEEMGESIEKPGPSNAFLDEWLAKRRNAASPNEPGDGAADADLKRRPGPRPTAPRARPAAQD